jgi:branched-chain amino acid transport system permease protein
MAGLVLQLLVGTISTGALYGLLGLSWSIIYDVCGVFHFAHSLVLVAGAYAAVMITAVAGLPLGVGFIGAVAVAVLAGCAIQWGLYSPLTTRARGRGGVQFNIFIASLGLAIVGENVITIIFGPEPRNVKGFSSLSIQAGPAMITTLDILIVVLTGVVIYGFWIYLTRTTSGKAMRAVSSNSDMAATLGINTARAKLLAVAFGSGMVGLAGVFIAMKGRALPSMGLDPFLYACIITFFGGVGSVPGAVVGGLILALAQNMSIIIIPGPSRILLPFIVLLFVIILRPQGLFGSEKA